MRTFAIDIDDIEQAIEISCGDSISRESFQPRTASRRETDRFRARLKRFLAEIPEGTTASEMLEAMD